MPAGTTIENPIVAFPRAAGVWVEGAGGMTAEDVTNCGLANDPNAKQATPATLPAGTEDETSGACGSAFV